MVYKLKSGQINFQNTTHNGSFVCVIIKNGKFSNLTDDLRKILIEALQENNDQLLEDMF